MCSQKERREALDLWFEHLGDMSIEDFVGGLGYPCASTILRWVKADPRYDSKPVITKLEAIKRVSEGASAARSAVAAGVVHRPELLKPGLLDTSHRVDDEI